MSTIEELQTLYSDPEIGGQSAAVFHKRLKNLGKTYSRKQIDEFFQWRKSNPSSVFSRGPTITKADYAPIYSQWPTRYQLDIMFFNKYGPANGGYTNILMLVNTITRQLWAMPIKDKKPETVAAAMRPTLEDIRKNAPHLFPLSIQTDEGSEYLEPFDKLCRENGIAHYVVLKRDPGQHRSLGKIDAAIRTIRHRIINIIEETDNTRWKSYLDKVIKGYNDTPHKGLFGHTPNEVGDSSELIQEVIDRYNERMKAYIKRRDKKFDWISPGVKVRVREPTKTFSKDAPKWSREVYTVVGWSSRNRLKVELSNGQDYMPIDLRQVLGGTQSTVTQAADKTRHEAATVRRQVREQLGPVRRHGENVGEIEIPVSLRPHAVPDKKNRLVRERRPNRNFADYLLG